MCVYFTLNIVKSRPQTQIRRETLPNRLGPMLYIKSRDTSLQLKNNKSQIIQRNNNRSLTEACVIQRFAARSSVRRLEGSGNGRLECQSHCTIFFNISFDALRGHARCAPFPELLTSYPPERWLALNNVYY